MKNISLFVIIDSLFKISLLVLFNFIWSFYFIKNGIAAIILSIILAVVFTILINKYSSKKHRRKLNLLNEQQKVIDITNTFIYMTPKEILNFFYRLVSTKHGCQIKSDYIEIGETDKIILCPIFKNENLSADDVIGFYKKIKHKKIKRLIFLTNKYDIAINSTLCNFEFESIILDAKQTYFDLLCFYEFYPKITIKTKPKAKNTLKQILAYSFNKKKTKGYLLSAFVIFFASLFVVYRIYYLIVCSTLILFAIFSYFNPSFNTKPSQKLLD